MAIYKCKMCGGNLEITDSISVCECEYCGTKQTVPTADDEKKTNLFNRANRLRMDSEFDKAAGVYETIVSEFPEEAEGYWGLVLCTYGIEYVDDTKTGRKIPTCHRTSVTSIMDDDNFAQACENADASARSLYREEAKEIDKLQQKIISIVENEEPYDVFICYKETDDISRERTEDSQIAQDIYTELIKDGYKVFFSRITLREKAGSEYEPYIYSALSSAKVMLAIGTKYEYYDAVWVKNEWSRYLAMMANDSSKHLLPCYKNLDAYDIPKEFKNLQALDMGEVTFFKSLTDNVRRFIPKHEAEPINVVMQNSSNAVNSPSTEPLLKRALMFLEDGDWNSADEYCEKVLDIDPENATAYLYKFMANNKLSNINDIPSISTKNKTGGAFTLLGIEGSKLSAIKILREAMGLGLKEAKDLVEGLPAKLELEEPYVNRLLEIGAVFENSVSVTDLTEDPILQKFFKFASPQETAKIKGIIDAFNEELAKLEEERKAEKIARLEEEKRKADELARLEEEKKKADELARLEEEKLMSSRRAQGKCQHCGGELKKGLFSKKCTSCGKVKDY